MKRLFAIAAVLVSCAVLVVFAVGAGSDSGGYKVRAIFDNAAFVIPGMDVKIAGVVVGSVDSIDLTPDKKAAMVLNINDPAYRDFRTDAFCTIRPQSLIGERYVECEPTQPGAGEMPALRRIAAGPGKGQYLLPSDRTTRSVDLDLINNIMRLPFRERLTIFLNEFGTALAGNGANLHEALTKASPALRQLDDVLGILASENRRLARLAVDGDRVLAPLARERQSVTGFINASAVTAKATAERSADLALDLQRLPAFLTELGPTMDRLGEFSTAFTPIAQDLQSVTGSLNTVVTGAPEFTSNATTALESLGDTAVVTGPELQNSLSMTQDLGQLTRQAAPLATNLSLLLRSTDMKGGINRLLDFVFYGAGATNPYDQYGHYLRARLILNTCQTYATVQTSGDGCSANFQKDFGAVTTPAVPKGEPTSVPIPSSGATTSRALTQRAPASGTTSRSAPVKPVNTRDAIPLLDYLLGQ
ncbi:unannotated protein [freshwater metagenome]|uniref:Unannotated protein n=1 Tax=freshwater metagenome TaxID=449393 RepID=A0A6J7E4Q3_9ZZZZ|nr:MCE family protein [Actinomycetota bacterium]